MTVDMKALKEAAEKATPGPWRTDDHGDEVFIVGQPTWPCERFGAVGEWTVATVDDLCGEHDDEWYANAEFIALANPSTILSLIERCEELEGALRGRD